MDILLKSLEFAAEKHRNDRRKGADRSPYINHPIEVASILANIGGVYNISILAAAILHDTIEDTDTSPNEVEKAFGREICSMVKEVTDDKSLSRVKRKRLQVENAPLLSTAAKLIEIADKISNIREVTDNPPSRWSLKRRREYVDWAERVVAGCRGVNQGLETFFDQVLRRAREILWEKP
ncbi:MAG: bifunctional (p)ppGpp synthetase/guanosine-3',5'-bis(diphosphate) 3'-pyrophosphohydrolase [Deltaproteobacteria bacterium]|nr:bifunctional (p)ppGpp synthetase/guanosine-3',5'-bis(diphosphate) 3'-pyrophosphohydrolase [Deltaproteobacteria bacterium]